MTETGPHVPPRRRVLVVEDDSLSATMLSLLLEELGHEVRIVTDGSVAVEAAREFRPDVLLCDLRLDGSVDGFGVADSFTADPSLADVARVALSGLGRREVRDLCGDASFEAVLTKPADADELQDVLQRVGGRRGRRGDAAGG